MAEEANATVLQNRAGRFFPCLSSFCTPPEMEMQTEEVTYIQKDGTPTTNGAAVGRYSLISFADFLAGKPAYREINTQYIEPLW